MKRQRERERSWRRTASSQLQQRGLADLDPGWVGMILAKQLREMTAVRQGRTDRDSSLSPSRSSMFLLSPLSLLPVMAIDFSQPKQEAPLSPEVAELVKRSQKQKIKSLKWSLGGRNNKVRKAKGGKCKKDVGGGGARRSTPSTLSLDVLISLQACQKTSFPRDDMEA